MHNGRILAERGFTKVKAVVQTVTATTHSYTIQPTISATLSQSPEDIEDAVPLPQLVTAKTIPMDGTGNIQPSDIYSNLLFTKI
ncbi:hypothetical protein Trydic_g3996 [Trypoxylus dichotomus]